MYPVTTWLQLCALPNNLVHQIAQEKLDVSALRRSRAIFFKLSLIRSIISPPLHPPNFLWDWQGAINLCLMSLPKNKKVANQLIGWDFFEFFAQGYELLLPLHLHIFFYYTFAQNILCNILIYCNARVKYKNIYLG